MEIQLSNLKKSYFGDGKEEKSLVLSDINVKFESGRLYIIKGISGSGKTTLLNVIGGIDKDFEGEIRYSENGLKRAAYVFQESLLLSGLSVRENLDLLYPGSERIESLCEQLGISDLLSRRTEELSGGERQRIAIVRALLMDSPLILADEPTASLDESNSLIVAKTLASLKDSGRIIIVATHEPYFDDFADEILSLKYGVIEKIEQNTENLSDDQKYDQTEIRNNTGRHRTIKSRVEDLSKQYYYIWKRRKKSFSLRSILTIAMALCLLLVVSAIQNNLTPELVREYQKKYPMDVIELREMMLDKVLSDPSVKVYYDYRISDDSYEVYSLLPEEYSCMSFPGMIEYGSFPKDKNEVLLSSSVAGNLEKSAAEELIGDTVEIGGANYRISGITGDLIESKLVNNRVKNFYYRYDFPSNSVFVPYETAKECGEVHHGDYVMCVWTGLSENEKAQAFVKRINWDYLSRYHNEVQEIQKKADLYIYFFYIVLILIFLSAGIFICSLIHVDLFYRRRELGFLQIFGMNKRRVVQMVTREYFMKYLISLGLSFVLFAIALIIAAFIRGRLLFPDFFVCFILESLLCTIYICSVLIGVSTFLRKSPAQLIGRT